MKLSFVILNYRTPDHLRVCLLNIQKLALPFAHEIIVVDNASKDTTARMMKTQFPGVAFIENARNLGHPAGNNVGLRIAKGTIIAILNPDILLRDAADIRNIIAYMDAHDDVAFLGPKLKNIDGTVQASCYRKYSRMTPLFRRTLFGKLPAGKRDIERHLMADFAHNETREVEWLLGACIFIRKAAMDTIGLMNEELFLYFGDYEWCDRAHRSGWKVVYFHATEHIFHYHKRESAGSRFAVPQIFSYVTRIHIKDWLHYNRLTSSYAHRTT